MSAIEHTHILDSEGELCTECGLFEEFFKDLPDCIAMDNDEENETEIEETLS